MKVGGRLIQNRLVFENTAYNFDALYKKHRILVEKLSQFTRDTPTYHVFIFKDKSGEVIFEENVRRWTIQDALIVGLNESKL
ncbi:hypothetical protein D3C87_1267460 [compost metagenome]